MIFIEVRNQVQTYFLRQADSISQKHSLISIDLQHYQHACGRDGGEDRDRPSKLASRLDPRGCPVTDSHRGRPGLSASSAIVIANSPLSPG